MKIKDRRLNWVGNWAQVEYSDLSRMYTMRIYLSRDLSEKTDEARKQFSLPLVPEVSFLRVA